MISYSNDRSGSKRSFFLVKTPFASRTIRRCYGLTLLELLVVLVILAIMATIAVQAIQPRVENARFEATRSTMANIVESVVGHGDRTQSDGTPMIDGFVADIGRIPFAVSQEPLVAPEPAEQAPIFSLNELWNPECDLAVQFPFQFRAGPREPEDFSDVRIACGWRGPYVMLPIGAHELRDGWGNPFEVLLDDAGTMKGIRASTLFANEPQELEASFDAGKVNVTGTVVLEGKYEGEVRVVLLAPQPESSLDELVVYDDEDDGRLFFRFQNVPIGLRRSGKRRTRSRGSLHSRSAGRANITVKIQSTQDDEADSDSKSP
ncbi:MAG: prepilin-type N-terminal cleavage/methylation domain-containing protein [Pirellulaceae bacterium]